MCVAKMHGRNECANSMWISLDKKLWFLHCKCCISALSRDQSNLQQYEHFKLTFDSLRYISILILHTNYCERCKEARRWLICRSPLHISPEQMISNMNISTGTCLALLHRRSLIRLADFPCIMDRCSSLGRRSKSCSNHAGCILQNTK